MEQRPLRLGDLVDDYCPRERRVTNHAIVAIVNDVIRQTRCTACDTEHVYKGGRIPRQRVRPAAADRVPADRTGGQLVTVVQASAEATGPARLEAAVFDGSERSAVSEPAGTDGSENLVARDALGAAAAAKPPASGESDQEDRHHWPANRQLIRATLPRSEGEAPPPRPIPEFTIYQRQNGRGRGFQGRGWTNRSQGGNGERGGDRRSGPGFGGQGRGRRRHGKRRPR